MNPIWIASYPRSGNTYLRTILTHCFGLKTGSIYPHDLGGNTQLEQHVGHIEHNSQGEIEFGDQKVHLVKTHGLNSNTDKAIYILRDARPASMSLFNFFRGRISLEQIIFGNHHYGIWRDHVASWAPQTRKNTLFLKYEDLLSDRETQLDRISDFLQADLISRSIPDRNEIALNADGWVRKESNWEDEMPKVAIELCTEVNKKMLEEFKYI